MHINTLLSYFLVASSIITAIVAIYSQQRKNELSLMFSLTCVSSLIYTFGYSMELLSHSLNNMLFWNRIQYFGLPFLAPFWILLSLQYTNKKMSKSFFVRIAVFIIPVLTLIFRFTNNLHHLFYFSIGLNKEGPFPTLQIIKGPWFILYALFVILGVSYTVFLYYIQYRKSKGVVRKQCIIMLFASLVPILAFILNYYGFIPYGIDIGPFSTSISCFLFVLALFRYNLLNLKPLAREYVFEYTLDGIIVLDTNNKIIDYNPAASRILPLNTDSINKEISEVLSEYGEIIRSVYNFVETRCDIVSNGKVINYHIKNNQIYSNKAQLIGTILTITEITSYVDVMEKFNRLATRDELTGIYNRRHFLELSQAELNRTRTQCSPLSIALLDIDHFKDVNDSYGHHGGDLVLQELTKACIQSIRTCDIIGRYGGEEFVILFPGTGIRDAANAAERVRQNIQNLRVSYEGNEIRITASIGVCGTDGYEDKNLDSLLKCADGAMYKAKEKGRNCVVVQG